MATDFGEKEREFIDGLKENTGRDLGEWMEAISGAGLVQRNDIIEWLRRNGLMFSKASWLERIHHNGGRPIYAGVPPEATPRRPPQRRREPIASEAYVPVLAGAGAKATPAASVSVPSGTPATTATAPPEDLDSLLVRAKAYRPLAQHVLGKIRQASPGATVSVRESSVAVGAPAPFAVLGITAKELRLHLALGDHPFDDVVRKGQAGGGLGKGEALTHMLVLNDARQVDARFMELLALAVAGAGG